MTFLELFARAYMTPQEISVETHIPLKMVYALRDGKPVEERYAMRVLRLLNGRLHTAIPLRDMQFKRAPDTL